MRTATSSVPRTVAARSSFYLLDTNVISELRKGERVDANVTAWFAEVAGSAATRTRRPSTAGSLC